MNKVAIWFFLSCKRQVKRPFFLFLLILFPLAMIGIRQTERQDTEGIKIAFYMEEDPAGGEAERIFFDRVREQLLKDQEAFTFYECSDSTELLKEVSARNAECGYVFNQGVLEKLDSGKYKNSIQLVTAPSTVAAKLSTEVVFASMFQVYGEKLLKDYAEKNDLFHVVSFEEAWKELKPLYEKYSSDGSTFSFNYSTYGQSGGQEAAGMGMKPAFPVRGLVAVYVFLTGLFSAVMLWEDEKRGLFLPVQASVRHICALSSMAAPVFLAAVSGLAALWLTGEAAGMGKETGLMAVYVVLTAVFSWILHRVIRQQLVLCSLIPFAAMASLLVCPVFVDISAFVPSVRLLRLCFLPYYYMMGSHFF